MLKVVHIYIYSCRFRLRPTQLEKFDWADTLYSYFKLQVLIQSFDIILNSMSDALNNTCMIQSTTRFLAEFLQMSDPEIPVFLINGYILRRQGAR